MDNQTQPNIPPFQSQTQTPTLPLTNWFKILLFSIFGLIIIAGSIFAGIQIGKNQTPSQQPITEQSNISPTQTVVYPTIIPTKSIPTTNLASNWETYIDEGYGFTFNYPKNWKVEKSGGLAGSEVPLSTVLKTISPYILDIKPIMDKNSGVDFTLTSDIMINPENTSINPEMTMSEAEVSGLKIKMYHFINNAGINVRIYTGFGLTNLPYFSITTYYPDKDLIVIDGILSTFKFTK